MKKFMPMAVVAVCVASVAFASVQRPAGVCVQPQAVVDTLPDTTHLPQKPDSLHKDSTSVDTSAVSH